MAELKDDYDKWQEQTNTPLYKPVWPKLAAGINKCDLLSTEMAWNLIVASPLDFNYTLISLWQKIDKTRETQKEINESCKPE